MNEPCKRSMPSSTSTGQPDHVLTPEQKRELTIDTMASWALSGLEPNREIVENINAFVNGDMTAGEYLQKIRERHPKAGE
ncbi:antitoxin VbhA family protein [Pseudarthrobacter sp. NPDC092439]|uniref:antitoxin VbhA family protein n=1 Tax=unclassified Pseudarthrobacter TaxID=2647000 RepID=UPI003807DE26